MWSEKRALVQKAVEIAKENHPNGFNKAELIECSKEVFGGFSANPHKKIETMEDVSHMKNHMALVDGHYPLSMTSCEVVGINGGCGFFCPVFLEGKCDAVEEFSIDDVIAEFGKDGGIIEMYAHFSGQVKTTLTPGDLE